MAEAAQNTMPEIEQARAGALSSDKARDKRQQDELNQEPEGYADLTPEDNGQDNKPGADEMGEHSPQEREKIIQNQLNSDRLKNFVQNLQRFQQSEQNANFDVQKFSDENGVDISPEMMTTEEGAQSLDPKEKVRSKMYKYGFELRNRVLTGDYQAFYVALALALLGDLPALVALVAGIDPGILANLISFIVAPLLFYINSFSGTWFKRMLINKFFRQYIMTVVAENIPFVGEVYPGYTINVLLIKYYAEKEKKKNKHILKELTTKYKNLFGDDLFSAKGFMSGAGRNINLKRQFSRGETSEQPHQKSTPPQRPEMAPQPNSPQTGGAPKPQAPASSGQSVPLAA